MTAPSPPYNASRQYFGTAPDDTRPLLGIDGITAMSAPEVLILKKLRDQITKHAKGNREKQDFYEAKQVVQHLDISVPAKMADIGVAVGWAGTTVDAIDERIDWLGWVTDDGQLDGLDEVYVDNDLEVESNYGHVDALTTGVGFVTVGVEETDILGRPSADKRVIVSVESSSTASLIWDYRERRSFAGLSQTFDDENNVIMETLYLRNSNLVFARNPDPYASTELQLVSRNDHNLNRCFMTRLPNRARPAQMDGRSEISAAVRYYTNAAVRTMLGMEVNREFYVAPQRFVLNAKPEDFGVTNDMSPEERWRKGLSVAMGMINIVPPRGDSSEGDPPSVQEFRPAPPTPFIEQVKAYSIQMSAETGLPATLFGFVTDNPTSGDAIVKSEFRLTRRSARRIGSFGQGWREVALLAQLAKKGTDIDLDFMRGVRCRFANPMIPTPGATSDEMQKMTAAKILVPDSVVTYELYGRLDDRQIKQLTKDKVAFEAKQARLAQQEAANQAKVAARANPPGTSAGPNNRPPSPASRPAASSAAP